MVYLADDGSLNGDWVSRYAIRFAALSTERTLNLLRHGAFPVLAVRIVQPSLLGIPRELHTPLAGHPRGLSSVWPFFRLFFPELDSVYLLRGMVVNPLRQNRADTFADTGQQRQHVLVRRYS